MKPKTILVVSITHPSSTSILFRVQDKALMLRVNWGIK